MRKLIVPQEGEAELGSAASASVEVALHRQRQRDTLQSVISSVIVVGLVGAVLALIAIIPWHTESVPIVTYQSPKPKPQEVDRPEVNQRARPNPPGQKSSRAKVIATNQPSPVSVPVPENPVPEGPFGMSDEIGEGWGDSEGDGSGGGGASFYGNYRKGKRVAYVVDFSGSMESTVDGGGTRVQGLRKELARSIENLNSNMQFTVIFFSSRCWTIETEGPDYVENGWNGLGSPPKANWYPATQNIKTQVVAQVQKMPADGGTSWFPGLKQAFTMSPPPDVVYLLSDGEPRDGNLVIDRIKEINPRGTPIDTIAFELPGSPAGMLLEISTLTGGRFSMVHKGERNFACALCDYKATR